MDLLQKSNKSWMFCILSKKCVEGKHYITSS